MKTKDKYTNVDFITYQSGVNTGYALASITNNPEILEVIKSPEFRKKENPFFKGLWQGYDRGLLDHKKENRKSQRIEELTKTKEKNRDQEMER